jgi:ribonuclease-3 family protein
MDWLAMYDRVQKRMDGPDYKDYKEQDRLHTRRKPGEMSALALAYMGDGIWELAVRERLLSLGEVKPHRLQKLSTMYVQAKSQSAILRDIYPMLTDEEKAVVRRGRNAKSRSVPKNAEVADYRYATAFESLLGFLYCSRAFTRLEEVLIASLRCAEHTGNGEDRS